MAVAATSMLRSVPDRSRSYQPAASPRRPLTAISPDGRITTPVTSSTPAHASIGSAPCCTSIGATRPRLANTERRPSGATEVARSKCSSNQVVASCEWITCDVAGALGTGVCTHATTAHVTTPTRARTARRDLCTTRVWPRRLAASRTVPPLPAFIIGSRLRDMASLNSFDARSTLRVDGASYTISRLGALAKIPNATVERLPVTLRILLENLLRNEDDAFVKRSDIEALARWNVRGQAEQEIAFRTSRVLLQDFTGVPAVVDLAAMRDAIVRLGGAPKRINPLQPVDLVIDHSVQVDEYGSDAAFLINAEKEFDRNRERYQFLRWGQEAFQNFRVVPPDTGIVHQVNLEYLASVVFTDEVDGTRRAYPDSLVGTDSHTTMINGLGVLGWGVGGIEAEAAMLGQPLSMLIPEVVGFKLFGKLPPGTTATDLVLTVTDRKS